MTETALKATCTRLFLLFHQGFKGLRHLEKARLSVLVARLQRSDLVERLASTY